MKAMLYNLYYIMFLVIRLFVSGFKSPGNTLSCIGRIILTPTKMKSWTEETLYADGDKIDFEVTS